MPNGVAVGDVVQIDPDFDPVFGGCCLVVDRIWSEGVRGYVQIPARPAAAQVYYRVEFAHIRVIGKARWHEEVTRAR